MRKVSRCSNCGGGNLHQSAKEISAGGGHAPNYLPGLGTFFRAEKFVVILCADCGLARLFARPEALQNLSGSKHWTRVSAS